MDNLSYLMGIATSPGGGRDEETAAALAAHVDDKDNPHEVTKAQVGLGNVDNTRDMDKPVSTAVQAALDAKQGALTFDDTPTAGSANAVTSGGVRSALDEIEQSAEADVAPLYTPKTLGPASPVTLPDGIANAPLQHCVVQIEPVQSGSGDPSPDNVRPITGWDAATVTRTGKNLFGGEKFVDFVKSHKAANMFEVDESEHTVTVNGSMATGSLYSDFRVGKRYTIMFYAKTNIVTSHTNLSVRYKDGTSGYLSLVGGTVDEYRWWVFTTVAGKDVESLNTAFGTNNVIHTFDYEKFGIFEGVLTADDFEPYASTTVTTPFPETVYGGTLDVTAGELVVTHGNIASYNGETLPGEWISDRDVYPTKNLLEITANGVIFNNGVTFTVDKAAGTITVNGTNDGDNTIVYVVSGRVKWKEHMKAGEKYIFSGCPDGGGTDRYCCVAPDPYWKYDTGNGVNLVNFDDETGGEIRILISPGVTLNNAVFRPMIRLATETDDTFEPFKPATGAQVVYELASPLAYHLTPQQITTLLGTNVISADCGPVTVTYRGDIPNLYALHNAQQDKLDTVEASIAPAEGSFYATRNYSIGEYLTVQGQFYRVTAAIANGGAITVGSNVEATSVAASKQDILSTSDVFFSVLDEIAAPEMHRQIFRGKNLGTAFTTAQQAQIQAGTFKDLWLGDYWVINSVTWRIADFDYWYNCGDTAFTKHHIVVIPNKNLYSAKMNETNTTEGGYVGSAMRGGENYPTEGNLAQAYTAFSNAFGSALLTHREYLSNAVADGKPSGGAWFDSTVDLPNEVMIYGTHFFRPANDGTTIVNRYTTGNSQLALMQASPKFIKTRESYWLRDEVSATLFADVYGYGLADYATASNPLGVRPVAAVG